jgi:hypothetical protein
MGILGQLHFIFIISSRGEKLTEENDFKTNESSAVQKMRFLRINYNERSEARTRSQLNEISFDLLKQ